MRIAQNLTLKLKLDLMTYNFHQNSTFSRDYFKNYDEITSHALTFSTYTFYAYFTLYFQTRIHIYLQNKKLTIELAKQEITSKLA